jgi:hypothetical protein
MNHASAKTALPAAVHVHESSLVATDERGRILWVHGAAERLAPEEYDVPAPDRAGTRTPRLVDLDSDGRPETVFPLYARSGARELRVLSASGKLRATWRPPARLREGVGSSHGRDGAELWYSVEESESHGPVLWVVGRSSWRADSVAAQVSASGPTLGAYRTSGQIDWIRSIVLGGTPRTLIASSHSEPPGTLVSVLPPDFKQSRAPDLAQAGEPDEAQAHLLFTEGSGSVKQRPRLLDVAARDATLTVYLREWLQVLGRPASESAVDVPSWRQFDASMRLINGGMAAGYRGRAEATPAAVTVHQWSGHSWRRLPPRMGEPGPGAGK